MNRNRLLPLMVELTLVTFVLCTCAAPPATPTATPVPIPEAPTPGDREDIAVSLEEATQLVLTEVVKPDDLDHEVIVFSWPEPLEPGDRLQPYRAPDLESPGQAIPIGNEAWFFWVDDAPGAASAHPTRFVLVDRATGEVSTSEEEWWPLLNGESVWVETEVYWDEANWAFSNVDWRPSKLDLSLHPHHLAKPLPGPALVDGSPGAGLVVNGWDEGQTLKEDMQASATGMLENLINAGFDPEYFGPPRDRGIVEDIHNWILDQSLELKTSQTALIYIVGHGSQTNQEGGICVGREGLWETDLANWLGMFDPGVHVIVIIDSCNSGSFIDTLREVADITVTSTGAHDSMWGDYDPKDAPRDNNPQDEGLEFSSGFIEDWDQIMGDPAERERVEARAERNNENFWEALVAESYLSALEKDAAYAHGISFPNMVRMIPLPAAAPTPPPVQEPEVSFIVDPSTISLGECALMSWTVANHELWQVSTNHHTVDPSGEEEVCPEESTTYELRVELDGVTYVFPVTLTVELPTPTPPQMGTTGVLMVINHCGTPLYFTIAGNMYEVEGNSSVSIQLPPGQHPFTISIPGFEDHNNTIDVEAGKSYGLPITCCVNTVGTPKKGCE